MYSIGEFSRIAQVSKRLLRYYDEIGLFQPIKAALLIACSPMFDDVIMYRPVKT